MHSVMKYATIALPPNAVTCARTIAKTSVTKLCKKPLKPPSSLMEVVSRIKKKFKFPKYLSILPPGTYDRGVISTPCLSRYGT